MFVDLYKQTLKYVDSDARSNDKVIWLLLSL